MNAALDETVRASGATGASLARDKDEAGTFWSGRMHGGVAGDRRAGVVWHTQGSGKSLSMLFYAGRVVRHPAMRNPTLVVLTDRNDLDDQLFGQFQRCHDLLGQTPVQAESRGHLRELLRVASGGVVFTTIQKFQPEKDERAPLLSDRANIVVIADEAHRSQYDLVDGLARHLRDGLPGASFIGFTGTPIETTDANTRAVFGDYISIYDIQRAVADQATVPIYYESRIAQLRLNAAAMSDLDEEFEEITEAEEPSRREQLRSKWAALEALVGEPKRVALIAESGGHGAPTYDTSQAVAVMLEKHRVATDMLHPLNWTAWTAGPDLARLPLIPAGQQRILEQDNGKGRFVQLVTELSQAFALCAASDEATAIRDDVAYCQHVQAALNKHFPATRKTPEQIDAAIRQLVSKAIAPDGQIIDVFTAAGLARPDIGILSDQFLAEVRGLKHRNVAAELLEKLLKDELKARARRNLVQAQLFSEKLKHTLNAYHNRAIATQEVIEELIRLAKDLDAATKRGADLGLTDDEVAFYDALAANESAMQAMGDAALRVIATELVTQVRKSVTIDWTVRDSARARIRVLVKRILNRYGYPPDLQDAAVKTVLAQAELLSAEWARA